MSSLRDQLIPVLSVFLLLTSVASGLQWTSHQRVFVRAWTIIPVAIPFIYFAKLTIFPEYFIVDVLLVLLYFVIDEQTTDWFSECMNSISSRFNVDIAGAFVYLPTIVCCTFVNLVLAILGTDWATANLASMVFETMVTTINVKVLSHIFLEPQGWTDPRMLVTLCLGVLMIELGEWKLLGAPDAFPFYRTWGEALWSYVGVSGIALLGLALRKDSGDKHKLARHTRHPLYTETKENVTTFLHEALKVLQDEKCEFSMPAKTRLLILLAFGHAGLEIGERGSQSFGASVQRLHRIFGQDCFKSELQEEVEKAMRTNSVNMLCLINQNPGACEVVLVVFLVCIVLILVVAGKASDVFQGLFCLRNVTLQSILTVVVVTVLALKISLYLLVKNLSKTWTIVFSDTWKNDIVKALKDKNIGNCYTISMQNTHGKTLSIEFQEGAVAPSAVVKESEFPLTLIAEPRWSCEAARDAPASTAAPSDAPTAAPSESSESWCPSWFTAWRSVLSDETSQSKQSGSGMQDVLNIFAEGARQRLPVTVPAELSAKVTEIQEGFSSSMKESLNRCADAAGEKAIASTTRLVHNVEREAVRKVQDLADGGIKRLGFDEVGPNMESMDPDLPSRQRNTCRPRVSSHAAGGVDATPIHADAKPTSHKPIAQPPPPYRPPTDAISDEPHDLPDSK